MIIYQIAAKLHFACEQGAWMTMTGEAGPLKTRLGWADAPWLRVSDLAALLWNERKLVLSVAGAICVLGLAAALMAPRAYTAHSELLVRMGEEYVYQPTAGQQGAGAGAAPDMQAVVNSEMRLIGSGAVVRAAISDVGLATLYPAIARGPGSAALKMAAAERAFTQHLTVETAPQTPSIGLSFSHPKPEIAARALNALIDQYLSRRRDVLTGGEYEALSQESSDLSTRAGAATMALAAFLNQNQIGDFDAEMQALSARSGDIETQLMDAQAKAQEADARAGALRARYQAEPAEILLSTESDARRSLVQAQMEREQLLSRYQDDALPVREVDRRIAQLQQFLAGGDPAGTVRRGVNPVRQDIATQLVTTDAEARAQRGRQAALAQQRDQVRARIRAMQAIEPQYRQLLREKTILDTNAQNFASRAEEARARSQMLSRDTDNISPVERASIPTQGKSLRWPIMIVTLLLAAITATAAGLSRGLMRRSFPTPSSAARALNTPVLAVLPLTRAAKDPATRARPKRGKPSLTLVEGGAS